MVCGFHPKEARKRQTTRSRGVYFSGCVSGWAANMKHIEDRFALPSLGHHDQDMPRQLLSMGDPPKNGLSSWVNWEGCHLDVTPTIHQPQFHWWRWKPRWFWVRNPSTAPWPSSRCGQFCQNTRAGSWMTLNHCFACRAKLTLTKSLGKR